MCLLSCKDASAKWDLAHLKTALKANKDGFGFIGIVDGKYRIAKGTTPEELEAALPLFQDLQAIFHARWATHGTKTQDMLHPYKVAGSIYMAHNGIFNIATPDATKSDTWHMARALGSLGIPTLTSAIQNEAWLTSFEKYIGTNKVAFIEPTIGIVIVNKNLGHFVNGVWMSNLSYKSYTYDRGGVSTTKRGTERKPLSKVEGFYDQYGYPRDTYDAPSYYFGDDEYDESDYSYDLLRPSTATSTSTHPVDIMESWMDDKYPYGLIKADFITDPTSATSAVQMLIGRVKSLEAKLKQGPKPAEVPVTV